MIDTNIKGLVGMTRSVLPGMVARNRGHVINLGSVAGKKERKERCEVPADLHVYIGSVVFVLICTATSFPPPHRHLSLQGRQRLRRDQGAYMPAKKTPTIHPCSPPAFNHPPPHPSIALRTTPPKSHVSNPRPRNKQAFVRTFSLNLRADLLGTAIRVTNVEPGMCETEFSSIRFGGDTAKAKEVYQGMEPITAEDVAETIFWCATLPAHVNVNTMELMPVSQAFSGFAVARWPSSK